MGERIKSQLSWLSQFVATSHVGDPKMVRQGKVIAPSEKQTVKRLPQSLSTQRSTIPALWALGIRNNPEYPTGELEAAVEPVTFSCWPAQASSQVSGIWYFCRTPWNRGLLGGKVNEFLRCGWNLHYDSIDSRDTRGPKRNIHCKRKPVEQAWTRKSSLSRSKQSLVQNTLSVLVLFKQVVHNLHFGRIVDGVTNLLRRSPWLLTRRETLFQSRHAQLFISVYLKTCTFKTLSRVMLSEPRKSPAQHAPHRSVPNPVITLGCRAWTGHWRAFFHRSAAHSCARNRRSLIRLKTTRVLSHLPKTACKHKNETYTDHLRPPDFNSKTSCKETWF